MLERDDLDGIYLSLPVFAHGTPELDVIERGLPFLVEKPVAVNMEIARQIEEAVDAAVSSPVSATNYAIWVQHNWRVKCSQGKRLIWSLASIGPAVDAAIPTLGSVR